MRMDRLLAERVASSALFHSLQISDEKTDEKLNMHYYSLNIKDWSLHTSHLSLEEEAIYFRLINFYYDTEQPIPKETQSVFRRLRIGSVEKANAILAEFFVLGKKGWINKRCDVEIDLFKNKGEIARANGKKGGRPPKNKDLSDNPQITQSVILANPDHNQNEPTEKLTKNHKPITNNQLKTIGNCKKTKASKKLKTPFPENFGISDSVRAWAVKNNHQNLEKHLESFANKCQAKGYEYADWDAAFRNAISSNWANLPKNSSPSSTPLEGQKRVLDGKPQTYFTAVGWIDDEVKAA